MERLTGKTALVVGAGSIGPGWGNGKATAVLFAREGAQVFCVDRNGAAAEETAKIIASEGGKATAFTSDVSRAADVEAIVAACLKTYGRIDVLDNNVGIAETGNVVEVSEADWDRVRRQSQERLPRHEARHPGDGAAGRRLDHQYFLDRLDPSSRHLLCQLRHDQGRDEPDDAHHGGRVRAETYKGQRHSAGPDENADGRALRWPGGELRRRRRRGDVARARRAGADGAHGGSLGRRQRRTVFSPPTNQNTSPASNWWSMAALR